MNMTSLISNHCHISTNSTINGGVTIESGCFIGSNVTTKELIRITKNSFVKAGCSKNESVYNCRVERQSQRIC